MSKNQDKEEPSGSVCFSNGAPLYNIIQYNNIAQTDSNQENKNLIKERKKNVSKSSNVDRRYSKSVFQSQKINLI